MITNTVYLVRHAEKQDPNDEDTPISAIGRKRAIALKNVLADKNIRHIIVSQFTRTHQTAKPLEAAIHKTHTVIEIGDNMNDHVSQVVTSLNHFSCSLLVGHTDNIPAIIKRLTGRVVSIAENDFDNLYIITASKVNLAIKKKLTRTTYGLPSP